jgi:DNA modification methylase
MNEVQLLQVGERTEDEWADYIRAANIENMIIERGKRWLEFYEHCQKHSTKQGGSCFSEFARKRFGYSHSTAFCWVCIGQHADELVNIINKFSPDWGAMYAFTRLDAEQKQALLALVEADGGLINQHLLTQFTSEKGEYSLRKRRMAKAAKIPDRIDKRIIVGDFRDKGGVIADGSISLIFTDPPYDREAEKMFPGLAQFAERVLCDGGSIVFYCGHLQLPSIFNAFSSLRHWWTCANVFEGGGSKAMIREYGVRVCWKPLVWFVKTTRENKRDFLTDMHATPAREKGWHEWQQVVADATHWIKSVCPQGGVVCDTFLGGGTTAIAAEQLGLQWIGFEIDPETAASASERIYANRAIS